MNLQFGIFIDVAKTVTGLKSKSQMVAQRTYSYLQTGREEWEVDRKTAGRKRGGESRVHRKEV
jgi:hypothetical protein